MLDCEKYNPGEAMVKQYLKDTGRTVIDVSKTDDYWSQGIDLIAIRGQRTEKIEVKYCFNIHRYHSFFIELLSNEEKNQPGWIDYTKSDFIFYVDAISNECYIFYPQDIRDYLATHEYSTRECHKDKYKTSIGAIVPVEAFSKEYYLKTISLEKYAYLKRS